MISDLLNHQVRTSSMQLIVVYNKLNIVEKKLKYNQHLFRLYAETLPLSYVYIGIYLTFIEAQTIMRVPIYGGGGDDRTSPQSNKAEKKSINLFHITYSTRYDGKY